MSRQGTLIYALASGPIVFDVQRRPGGEVAMTAIHDGIAEPHEFSFTADIWREIIGAASAELDGRKARKGRKGRKGGKSRKGGTR